MVAGGQARTDVLIRPLRRWWALLRLLWRAGPAPAVALGVLVVVLGLLPTAIILATGELIGALPAAVEHGLGSADGTTALLAPAPPSVTGSCSATRGSGSAGGPEVRGR